MQDSIHLAEPAFEMPASTAQEYICLHAEENASAWNVAVRFRLCGELNITHLEAAINSVVAQHEILRTCFSRSGNVVEQHIAESCMVPVAFFDLSTSLVSEASELERISKAEARCIFNLTRPPLLRAGLIQLASAEHILLLTLHHAICDGWSVGILAAEIMRAYAAECQGAPLSLDDAVLQYADYAVTQNEYKSTLEYQSHAEFWRNELRDLQPSGSGYLSNVKETPIEAEIYSRLLPLALTRQIEGLARQEGLTFFEAVLSAFTLSRMTHANAQEITFATPVSGRNSGETEAMLGTFVNYLPVRVTSDPAITLSAFRRATADHFAALLTHAEFRTEDLLQEQPEILASLFDHVFICQRDFVPTVKGGGVELSAIPSVSPGALHAMTFFMVERTDGWRVSCEVDPSIYAANDAEKMLDHFEKILTAFTNLSVITVAEILQPNEEQAIALLHETDNVFEMPASEAQQRYWMLQQVQSEESSLHLRVRLRIQGDFKTDIAQRAFQSLLNRHETLRTSFTTEGEILKQRIHPEGVAPNFEVRDLTHENQDAIAALTSEMLYAEDRYSFGGDQDSLLRVLVLKISPSESILAITLPHLLADGWSCGLLLREFYEAYRAFNNGQEPSFEPLPIQYADYAFNEQQWLASAAMQARLAWWKDHLPAKLSPLDLPADPALASPGTEGIEVFALDPMLVSAAKQFARDEGTTLFSLYGAALVALLSKYTHQTDLALVTPFANRTAETEGLIGPFATPLLVRSTTQLSWTFRKFLASFQYDSMAAFENAIPPERCVELTGLQSRMGRHAINQISFFFQNAFVAETVTSDFKATPLPVTATGTAFEWQLAVIDYGAEVRLEFQYDVNLWSADSIRLVVKHYQRLLRECLFHSEKPLSQIEIATEEEMALKYTPERLLPISHRALNLHMPEQKKHHADSTIATSNAPTTYLERTLVAIWRDVFRRDTIGTQDNFFELGGHSLTLARIQTHLKKATGHRILAADIFAAPTIAALAQRIESPQDVSPQRIVPLRPEGSQPPLFLISQSMVFRRMVQWLPQEQPVFTVVMQEEDLKNGIHTTFEEIAAYYVALIRSVCPNGPYRIGGWCVSSWLAYEIAQQLRAAGQTVDLLLLVDGWAPGYWQRIGRMNRLTAKANYYGARILLHSRALSQVSFSKKLAFLAEKWRLMRAAAARQIATIFYSAGIKVEVRVEEQTTLMEQVIYAASRKYEAKPGSFEAALVFRSSEQPQGKFLPADLGWDALLQSDVDAIQLPGDHREIFDDPGAQIIAQAVVSHLALEPVEEANVSAPSPLTGLPGRKAGKQTACALVNI